MDAAPIPPPPPVEITPPEASSLADRLTNVIAAPGELFEEVKGAPVRTSNWLVPMILSCVLTIIYLTVAFSQPAVSRSMQEQRQAAMQKQIAAGKMTQAQADQATAMIDKVAKFFGIVGAFMATTCAVFLFAVVIWGGLKCFTSASVGYMRLVEICGLALVIDIPQKILRILLVVWKGNLLATASPTLFIDNPSATNKTHVLLSTLDVLDIWWLSVLSLGVSKVTGVKYSIAALITFGIWFGFRILATVLTPSGS